MSLAAESIATLTDRVYEVFGVAAVYTDREGAALEVTVVVDRQVSRYGEVAQVHGKTAVLCVRTSEVAGAPRKGETFAVTGGQTFTVDSLVSADEFEHRVLVA